MKLVVQKYGGSSVADVARLKHVAERVVARKRSGYSVVVVVSAMGDTTDRLLEKAREVTPEPPRRELDMLLSVGERTSMALLSMAIGALGEDAISFTGSQCGILTTDDHSRARIMEVRPFRVQDELRRGRIVIVAGYQGTSYKREITTLGRGGSDLTAVALAAALGAEACEIYSDVDGVLTADPRVVPDATRIESLSFDEMEALARGGAKVLNRQAIAWARRAQVALYARSTFALDSGPANSGSDSAGSGTVVRVDPPPRLQAVVGVTGRTDLVEVEGDAAACDGLLESVPLSHRLDTGESVRWIFDTEDVHEVDGLCAGLMAAGAHIRRPWGSVTVVGAGLGDELSSRAIIEEAFDGVPSALTELSWTAWMAPEAVKPLVARLHALLQLGSGPGDQSSA